MYKHQLKEHGVRVISALEPVSDDEGGEFYEMYLEWNAEKYSKRLSQRIRDGLTTAIENGTFTGAQLIYGYGLEDTAKMGKKGVIKRVVIDEEQAAVVRYIFSEYAKGAAKTEIATALNAQGHRLKGQPWRSRLFEEWLSNEKYTGTFTYGGRECKNQFPQIIDEALFHAVQERLKENRRLAGAKSATVPYLLTGKLFCGHCGSPMVSDGGTSRLGKSHYYYACKQKKKGACDKKRENKRALEEYVIGRIIAFLSDPKNVNRIADDVTAYYEKRTGVDGLKSIEVRITAAHKQVAEWSAAFVQAKSQMLRANIEKQITDYEVLINDLEMQKTKLELERGVRLTKKDIVSYVAEFLKADKNDTENWRRMVDVLIKKIYLYDTHISGFFSFTDSEIDSVTFEDANTAISSVLGVQTLSPILHHSVRIRTAQRTR